MRVRRRPECQNKKRVPPLQEEPAINSHLNLKIWIIATLTITFAVVIIRCIWQIVVIPTPKTMLLFIPLTVALLGANAATAYLVIKPEKLKKPPFLVGITAILTAGLFAGITHFVRFIISPLAYLFLSKVLAVLIILAGVSAYVMILWLIWSYRKTGKK